MTHDTHTRPDPVGVQAAIREYGDRNAGPSSPVGRGVYRTSFPVAVYPPRTPHVNTSERRAYEWLVERYEFEHGGPRRVQFGVDFAYGNVGFEVKSSKDYALSDNQREHLDELAFTFVVVSSGKGVWIQDCWLGEGETARFRA